MNNLPKVVTQCSNHYSELVLQLEKQDTVLCSLCTTSEVVTLQRRTYRRMYIYVYLSVYLPLCSY